MAVTGTILPKRYANVINRHEQKNKILSHATFVGNKQKQTEVGIFFVISNIVSIVTSPTKKMDHNEVHTITDLLQCSRSSAYCQRRTAFTKQEHLIAQVKNTSVKWSIKPRIVRTKKMGKSLRKEKFDWIMKNSNVCQSPITRDNLLIADADTKVKRRVPKRLLECSMRQLHNELIASPDDGGLVGARHAITNHCVTNYHIICYGMSGSN